MQLVWQFREYMKEMYPRSLPKVLLSCGWNNPRKVYRAITLLDTWPLLPPHDALELLDARFPHADIREYGVTCLSAFEDEELSLYMLQLVQALKYEPYLSSPLASFLLERYGIEIHTRKFILIIK